jgi:hypothetical protein
MTAVLPISFAVILSKNLASHWQKSLTESLSSSLTAVCAISLIGNWTVKAGSKLWQQAWSKSANLTADKKVNMIHGEPVSMPELYHNPDRHPEQHG